MYVNVYEFMNSERVQKQHNLNAENVIKRNYSPIIRYLVKEPSQQTITMALYIYISPINGGTNMKTKMSALFDTKRKNAR